MGPSNQILKFAREDNQFRKMLISSLQKFGSSKTLDQMMEPIRIQYLEELTFEFVSILKTKRCIVESNPNRMSVKFKLPFAEGPYQTFDFSFTFQEDGTKVRIAADGPSGRYQNAFDARKETPEQMIKKNWPYIEKWIVD